MEELNNSVQAGISEKVQGIESVEGTGTTGSELGTGTVVKPGEGIELQPGDAAATARKFLSKAGLERLWDIIKGVFIRNGIGITVSTDSKGVSDVYINGNDVTVKCAGSDGAEGNDGSISILANTGSYAKGSANKTIEILSADTAVIGTYDNDLGEVASKITFGNSTINIDSTEISVHTSGNGRFDIVEASTGSAYFQCSPNYTSVKGREFYVSRTGSQRAVVVTMNNDDDSTATIKLRGSATNNVTVTPDLNKIVGDTEFKDGWCFFGRPVGVRVFTPGWSFTSSNQTGSMSAISPNKNDLAGITECVYGSYGGVAIIPFYLYFSFYGNNLCVFMNNFSGSGVIGTTCMYLGSNLLNVTFCISTDADTFSLKVTAVGES